MGEKYRRVSAEFIRRIFNTARIVERTAAGEIRLTIVATNHPSAPLADEPLCTKSETVAYHDRAGVLLARAHRYFRRDGSLGASGRPDPKMMRDPNNPDVVYILEGR